VFTLTQKRQFTSDQPELDMLKLKSPTFFSVVSQLCETRTQFYHFRTAPMEIKWLIVERLLSLLIPFLCTPFLKPLIFCKFWWRQRQRERNYSGSKTAAAMVNVKYLFSSKVWTHNPPIPIHRTWTQVLST